MADATEPIETTSRTNLTDEKSELEVADNINITDKHYDEMLSKIDPASICDDVTIEFTTSKILSGTKDCSNSLISSCTEDGQSDCIISGNFRAANIDNIASKILIGSKIGGVIGTLKPSPELCSLDGQLGCVTSGNYKSVNISGISSAILTGQNIAGVDGSYNPDFPDASNVRTIDTVNELAGTYTPDFPDASNVRSVDTVNGVSGNLLNCNSDRALSCVSTNSFPSANIVNATAANIKSGVTIAGVNGTYGGGILSDCAADGEIGCKTVIAYRAVEMSNVTAGTVKSGTTIAGVSGDFPSATYPLTGASATADLSSAGFNSAIVSASSFEYWTSAGVRQVGTGDTDLIGNNIKNSISMFGVSGSLTESPANCSSDGEAGCVTVTAFKAADMSNVTAGTVKSGITIAGVTGDFPSATYPLTGASATADLSAAGFNASLSSASSFEYWNSAGVRQAGSGDTDLAANNIKISISMFGVSGSVTESPSNCSSDGETNCVAVTAFKAAEMSNVTGGTVKSGVTIAGVTGDFPSATNPLTGASATSDLSSAGFNSALVSASSFEYWTSAGTRQTGAGDTDLVAGNIKSSISLFGVSGSVTESPSNCSSDGEINCVAVTAFKAANMSNVSAGTVKSGETIAGVSGDYPSTTYPLNGATATADLTNFVTQLTTDGSFEYWDSKGARNTGSGDSDITDSKVTKDVLFENLSITGTQAPEVSLPFKKVYAGEFHSCGLISSGDAYCWGWNGNGRLGNGVSSGYYNSPTAVSGGHKFKTLSLGYGHTCGIISTGQSYCWGDRVYGRLGTGNDSDQIIPTAVNGGHIFSSIEASDHHSCALTSSGQAYCWGGGGAAQIGNGVYANQLSPSAVSGGHVFKSLSSLSHHTCGLKASGDTYCWGQGDLGQLGDGGTSAQVTPVAVNGGYKFIEVVTGIKRTCGLQSSGQVYCWGNGQYGQLGNSQSSNQSSPVAVSGGHKFTKVSSASYSSCGILSSGLSYCWGRNHEGQLGDGSNSDRSSPVAVSNSILFSDITTKGRHTCGRQSTGQVYCWGDGDNGALGTGNNSDTNVPVKVIQ